jgi:hypothetical protein
VTLASLDILDVWHALGGGSLRGKRGKGFWRAGDGYNVALDPAKRVWFDHRDGRGGGVLELVEVTLRYDRQSALQWLEANCGLELSRPMSPVERRRFRIERDDAEQFGIAAQALAEEALERLDGEDPNRADYTRLLGIVSKGRVVLTDEYRAWRETWPELTQAMVRAGASSRARVLRHLAFYLRGVANAA